MTNRNLKESEVCTEKEPTLWRFTLGNEGIIDG